jgi:hypothetical protein
MKKFTQTNLYIVQVNTWNKYHLHRSIVKLCFQKNTYYAGIKILVLKNLLCRLTIMITVKAHLKQHYEETKIHNRFILLMYLSCLKMIQSHYQLGRINLV